MTDAVTSTNGDDNDNGRSEDSGAPGQRGSGNKHTIGGRVEGVEGVEWCANALPSRRTSYVLRVMSCVLRLTSYVCGLRQFKRADDMDGWWCSY